MCVSQCQLFRLEMLCSCWSSSGRAGARCWGQQDRPLHLHAPDRVPEANAGQRQKRPSLYSKAWLGKEHRGSIKFLSGHPRPGVVRGPREACGGPGAASAHRAHRELSSVLFSW